MPEPIVIAPVGELDIVSVGDFRAALADSEAGADRLIVDLSQVTFIDSSGIAALIEVHDRFRRQRRRVAIVVPDGTVAAVVLSLAGLRHKLPVVDSPQAALQA